MGIGEIMATIATAELPIIGQATPELVVFAASIAFFMFSASLCAFAVRAANSARTAEEDAGAMMRTVQDYAVEVRQLAAQMDRMNLAERSALSSEPEASSANEPLSNRIKSVRVGSRYDAGEADVAIAEQSADSPSDEYAADSADADPVATVSQTDGSAEPADQELAAADAHSDDSAADRLQEATRAAAEPRSLLSGMLRRR
ncbi:MAG: hypothetical protein AAGD92_05175 [Pseudomonadota bacterium]